MKKNGFTLVELLIVIGIISLLIGLAVPAYQAIFLRSKVTACQENLRQIGLSLKLYRERFDERWPQEGGIAFVMAPWFTGVISRDEKYAKVYICPGVKERMAPPETLMEAESAADVDPYSQISYAGRNIEEATISHLEPNKDAIVADDNEFEEPNHPDKTNVLWGDCTSITALDIIDYGNIPKLTVGPDSEDEELRKLRAD